MKRLAKVILIIILAVIATSCSKEKPKNDNPVVVHEYVDLGLPSGTLWATCNVGADNPEDFGDYFAWGETEPKDFFDWENCHVCATYERSRGHVVRGVRVSK